MEREKFHGRVKGQSQICAEPGCVNAGEFRAPTQHSAAGPMQGPGQYAYFCLEHVRAFNARYDWFSGMSREEIEEAQRPAAGWENAARFFAQAGVDSPPKWADFQDPLDAISARFKDGIRRGTAAQNSRFPAEERRALETLGLDETADLRAVRSNYSKLVRQFHPDRNGGDRRYEKKLQSVIEAYQVLKSSRQFGQ
jgi:DnaJ-domain-containing protein 1